jgi:ATP-binding cassette, subfamily B, bacterial
MPKFPHYRQHDAMDCGPTCLRMITKYYSRNVSIQELRELSEIGKEGVSLLGIAQAAEKIGFRSIAAKITVEKLFNEVPLPCVIHWGQNHFVVVTPNEESNSIFSSKKKAKITVADPALGIITYSQSEFESKWLSGITDGEKTGIALILQPTAKFYNSDLDLDVSKSTNNEGASSPKTKPKTDLGFIGIFHYLFRYKSLVIQLGLSLLVGSALQLILPFLTQSVVDIGIQTRNLSFIYLVLTAQTMLLFGRLSVEFIRSWILLHISTRINLSILSDFLIKLLKLPVSYFESKQTGDILQRIGDHSRIESFLTGTSLNTLFSLFNLIVFSIVLVFYNATIFVIFLIGSIIYTLWILIFLKYRRNLDFKRFALSSKNQSSIIQMIQSVPELKLNNAEIRKRWDWENLQVQEFQLSVKGLALQQYQQSGAIFINEGKNVFISFLAAAAVVHGEMTLGGMMALQYIIGQLNSPVEQLIQFIQHFQDAQISLERLNEVHGMEDEESSEKGYLRSLPENRDICFKDLTYTYPGAGNEPVLKNINFTIPEGKITAIVGSSGSGKTTLLKLLLKFQKDYKGSIKVGTSNLENISHRYWRNLCGTVMQEGYIFSDTIANNIAISDEVPNKIKLLHAVKVANIQSFIEELPLSYNTKIGSEGTGISQGQKQRLLIARSVYKNPDFLLFDEATNALDSENENIIMQNLEEFFQGKTVIIVAHRLSTVKNAHQIIVLEKGEVIEIGTHNELVEKSGRYFELVKNQLELGN